MPTIQDHKIDNKNRCIALYPGAFRPPHAAHLKAVLDLARRPDVDEVIVIISNRCRSIPGTTKALGPDVARRIWSIYLQGMKKVRVEIASHTSVKHALGYFARVESGDTLLFCIGESDFKAGDERFKGIKNFSKQTGVVALPIAAPTGSITVRATDLRKTLALGDAGHDVFSAALPRELDVAQRERVWTVCQEGMREISEIIQEKVRSFIIKNELGDIKEISSACDGKLDQVYRVRFKDNRCYFVKYAGDTVTSGSLGNKLSPKPKRRLSAERRALNRLRDHGIHEVDLPEVVLFDKETLTLVLTEVCPEGRPLLEDMRKGLFDPNVASQASRFLARCHNLKTPIAPVWGDQKSDQQHWERMLELHTGGIKSGRLSERLCHGLKRLKRASKITTEETIGNRLLMLDCSPKNIFVEGQKIGVIDFELSSSIGDPAYDLGLFLGHYVLWGLIAPSHFSAQKALQEAINVYRDKIGDLWSDIYPRVLAFTGATVLYQVIESDQNNFKKYELGLIRTAEALISFGLDQLEPIDQVLSSAISGKFA